MYNKNAHQAYQSVQITTADRAKLLLMMYEGAIKFLKQSKAGLDESDMPKFCRYLGKGQAIIAELMNTLDFEKGGSVARDLERLYDFMLFYLTEANIYRDGARVEHVVKLVEVVYSAFKEVIDDGRYLKDVGADHQPVPQLGEAIKRMQISL
jgi:flagellar protein FliS